MTSRTGTALGAGAILLWSLSASCIVLVGKHVGVWQFLGITALASGLLQMAGHAALGRRLRLILMPPPKLWLAIVFGFSLYLLLYTLGIVAARSPAQIAGVSLINYLWPPLSILFATLLVPGEKMSLRLAIAMAFSLAGVLLANSHRGAALEASGSLWPYIFAGGAAVTWALYCAYTSRWRGWAKAYAASPLGFLLVGMVALVVCLALREWQPMSARAWLAILLTALGPWSTGYMLWELALHHTSSIRLGLMAAGTPVLSTLWLIGLFAHTNPGSVDLGQTLLLCTAALMIGAGVALAMWKGTADK